MENKLITDFSQVIKSKNIVIPIIQRDYAQGRIDPSINSIRKKFIDSLFAAVHDNKEMDINYIYGINKQGDVFLPIDGQQRLTSIYLFLWFCAVKEGKTEEFCKYTKSFSYQVRETSENFFSALQKKKGNELVYRNDFESYVNDKEIKLDDFPWYKMEWHNDMTVNGAETFLDNIRSIANNNKKYFKDSVYTDKLLSLNNNNCPISLMLMVQDGSRSNNDQNDMSFDAENRAAITYINMNARGKILNNFENMKALINKTGSVPKKFVENYNNEYINVFLKVVDAKNSKLSLVQKVERMDEMASNFLLYIYRDLKAIDDKKTSRDECLMNYYQFMDCLRIKPNYPNSYFDFMKYVFDYLKDKDDDPGLEIFYQYCYNFSEANRYKFFSFFWEKFKKIDEDGYWSVLTEHLSINTWTEYLDFQRNFIKFKYFVNLVNIISDSKKGVLQYLGDCKDFEQLYDDITNKRKEDSLINIASLKEEVIKARIILHHNPNLSQEQKEDKLDEWGNEHDHKIRYLLYISGLWDNNITDDSWDILSRYAEIDEKVFSSYIKPGSFDWQKMYYLVGLECDDDQRFILPDKSYQRWDEDCLCWKTLDVPKTKISRLERVKKCFDEILNQKIEVYLEQIKDMVGLDRRIWLYYLLNREYDSLINNYINIKDSKYTMYDDGQDWNYYEKVLALDLQNLSQEFKCFKNKYPVYKEEYIRNNVSVKPKENDGYTKKRNISIILRMTYDLHSDGYICFRNDDKICRYQFRGFSPDKEDVFCYEKNDSIITESNEDFNSIKSDIDEMFGNDDNCSNMCYEMVFQEHFDGLKDGFKNSKENSTLEKYWTNGKITYKKVGSNNIYIYIYNIYGKRS